MIKKLISSGPAEIQQFVGRNPTGKSIAAKIIKSLSLALAPKTVTNEYGDDLQAIKKVALKNK